MKNEPAFPCHAWGHFQEEYFNGGEKDPAMIPYGLTKREYFAGLAMQGMTGSQIKIAKMQQKIPKVKNIPLEKMVAGLAVEYADALIAELEKSDD